MDTEWRSVARLGKVGLRGLLDLLALGGDDVGRGRRLLRLLLHDARLLLVLGDLHLLLLHLDRRLLKDRLLLGQLRLQRRHDRLGRVELVEPHHQPRALLAHLVRVRGRG